MQIEHSSQFVKARTAATPSLLNAKIYVEGDIPTNHFRTDS